MKKSAFFVLATIFFFSFFLHTAGAQESKTPRLVVKGGLFDAGEIDEGNVIKHSFTVYNRGNAPLNIRNVRPG